MNLVWRFCNCLLNVALRFAIRYGTASVAFTGIFRKIQWRPLIIIADNVINRLLLVITISDPKTLHLKSIKNKPFIITNLSVIVIKLKIIRVHI
jgi:hypothetical protein